MATKRENVLPDYRVILLVAATLLLLYLLGPILSPFLIAAILAYICTPLVDRLAPFKLGKWQLGRSTSALIVMFLLFGIMTAIVLIIVPLLQKEIVLVIERIPAYLDTLRNRFEPWLLHHFGVTLAIDTAQIQEVLKTNWKSASNFVGNVLVAVSSHGLAFIVWVTNLLLIPVVLFYLLRDWHHLIAHIAEIIPKRWYAKSKVIAVEIDAVLAAFLRGQLLVMLLTSIFYSAGLWMAGLELAIPIGLIAGLLGFVPYLGPAIGISLALLAGALQFDSLNQFIPVLAVFGIGQLLESFVLTPWLIGDRIGLHPVVVIFALLAGGQLFGFTGVLVALPVSAALAVGFKHARQRYIASDIYLK